MAVYPRHVLFFDPVSWMGHEISPLAVVGKQQEAGRLAIEAAYRESTDIGWGEFGYRSFSVRRPHSCHDTGRLIEREVDVPLLGERLTPDQDGIGQRVGTLAYCRLCPVDGHVARRDHTLRLPPRCNPGGRKDFLEPLFHHSSACVVSNTRYAL